SSQNEQDNRLYGLVGYVPVYEPYSPREAKDLTRYLFEISERFKTLIMLRLTTRLCHTRGSVILGEIPPARRKGGKFSRNKERWVLLPVNARRLRREAIQRLEKIREFNENFEFNHLKLDGDEDVGIIASGVAFGYLKEALNQLKLADKVALLKLTSIHPIPLNLVSRLVRSVNKVIVVEELEPFIENQVKTIAPSGVRVHGKDVFPLAGELNLERVIEGIGRALNIKVKVSEPSVDFTVLERLRENIPPRSPVLCPGCPHRATFFELKRALENKRVKAVFCGDIGCYTLGYYPPYEEIDTTLCMGASIGLASGLGKFAENLTVAIIGDSTFFHAGLPPLINSVYSCSPILIIVLDNAITAMTGHQPHPGTGFNALWRPAKKVRVEDIAKGIGVEYVDVINPYNVEESVLRLSKAIEYVLKEKRPAVVVSRRECALYSLRKLRRKGVVTEIFQIDREKCKLCMFCVKSFGCPAIIVTPEGYVTIDEGLCVGCGVCAQLCPVGAIQPKGRGVRLDEL
ncbi:MAG: indolepyruvate ferredoxin oxidoreductase subunit alpha, partial [Thermoprotei archaeon]